MNILLGEALIPSQKPVECLFGDLYCESKKAGTICETLSVSQSSDRSWRILISGTELP